MLNFSTSTATGTTVAIRNLSIFTVTRMIKKLLLRLSPILQVLPATRIARIMLLAATTTTTTTTAAAAATTTTTTTTTTSAAAATTTAATATAATATAAA